MISSVVLNLHLIFRPITCVLNQTHLLMSFVTREIQGRFAGTFAGVLWTLINPAATIIVYMFLFSVVIRVPITAQETGTDSFLIYFLSGLFPWLIFAEALSRSLGSLIGNANLITKVVFPVELLPTSSLVSSLIINGIGMVLFIVYMAIQGYCHLTWFWLGIIFLMQVFFTWGLVLFFSSLTVFIRDLQELIAIVLMVWFYGTPIIYPMSLLPDRLIHIMMFNPLAILIQLYRDVLLKHNVSEGPLYIFLVISLLVYVFGSWFFMRSKSALADVI